MENQEKTFFVGPIIVLNGVLIYSVAAALRQV